MSDIEKKILRRWEYYMKIKTPVAIISKPKEFENDEPIAVVPTRAKKFLLAGFQTTELAKDFCERNSLPVSSLKK